MWKRLALLWALALAAWALTHGFLAHGFAVPWVGTGVLLLLGLMVQRSLRFGRSITKPVSALCSRVTAIGEVPHQTLAAFVQGLEWKK